MGPLLWDITYDNVLEMPKLRESEIICYADDTMVLVGGWMDGGEYRKNDR